MSKSKETLTKKTLDIPKIKDAINHARTGNLEFFKDADKEILSKAEDISGNSVLSIVVSGGKHVHCCEVICEKCPSLLYHQSRLGGYTPLHIAARKGNLEILKVLISTCDKADQEVGSQQKIFTLKNSYGYNAMHNAVFNSQTECINLLIEEDPNKELLKAGDKDNNTPLHLAAKLKKNPEIARLLFAADPSFEYGANSEGKTPLHFAIDNSANPQSREMLKVIMNLQRTQSTVSTNEKGWAALHYCVDKRKFDVIGLIIQSCPESSQVTDNTGQNFIHHAVKLSGSVEKVKSILGMEQITSTVLNSPDQLRKTPLDVAVESKNAKMILYLLEHPLLENKKLTVEPDKLKWVVEQHQFKIMNMLLETNDDLLKNIEPEVFQNSKNREGDTILFKAAQGNHLSLCEALCRRDKSQIYYQSKDRSTALHHAASSGEPDMLKFLIGNDEDSEVPQSGGGTRNEKKLLMMRDKQDDTALHKAVLNHKLEAVKLLVEADVDQEYSANTAGDTPIMISIREAQSNKNKLDTGKIRKLLFEKQKSSQTMAHKFENGWTLLHQATSDGDLSIIEDIIKFCPEKLDGRDDREDKNFLHMAVELGNVEVVRQVLRADPEQTINVLNGKDQKGQNFLHIAAELGNVKIVRQVLRTTGIPDVVFKQQDNEGKNFLHIAAELEKIEVVKEVLRDDRDILEVHVLNKKDNDGNTPFHIAALTGNEPLTRCFLFHQRVDKATTNNTGHRVLSEIKFPYDKRKAEVHGIADTVDQIDLKDQRELDLLVVALIATVSFTAGITVPGGYISDKQDKGTAVLSTEVSFAAFIISNTLALIFSLYAVISHFCARRISKEADIKVQLILATFSTLAAIYCMIAAFIAGSFAVLANSNWLAIVVCIISGLFCICAGYPICTMQFKRAAPASQHTRSSTIQDGQSSQAVEVSVAQCTTDSPGSNAAQVDSPV